MASERPISMPEAMSALADAQEMIARVTLTLDRQRLWAEEIVRVPPTNGHPLTAADVSEAIRAIARVEHGEWWRLELAEILREAKRVRRERIGATTTEAPRVREPETPRSRAMREVARLLFERKIKPSDFEAEVKRRMRET